ncbi:hypothetical protein ACWD6K_25780 [Streptomyces sp. NPDC002431]
MPDLTGADLVVHCAAAVGDPVPGSPAEAAMRAVNVDGRDEAVRTVLRAHGIRARVAHVPLPVARTRSRRYAVDQLAHSVVLDVSRTEFAGVDGRAFPRGLRPAPERGRDEPRDRS